MTTTATRPPKLPPAWFKHLFWRGHRVLYRLSGGRFLWTTSSKRGWGALRLTTIGRKSGRQRSVIVGYIEDGPNLVVLAMNGWDEGHPAWWLNLEAHPDAVVRLAGQPARPGPRVRGRGRRARSTVAALGRGRRGARWLCRSAVDRDAGRRLRTTRRQPPDVRAEVRRPSRPTPAEWTGDRAGGLGGG